MSETDLLSRTSHQQCPRKPFAFRAVQRTYTRRTLKESKTAYPIPKGDTPYVRAKRAEYIERNLAKAEFFYKQAIRLADRPDSSVKDLAGIMHQQGRTAEACKLLEQHQHLFKADQAKYENLLQNLQRQVTPSGNCLNKTLKVSGLTRSATATEVCQLFENSTRILAVTLDTEVGVDAQFAMLKFTSHSAARKTLESFHKWDQHKVEWVSVTGEVVGDACHNKDKAVEGKRLDTFAFAYSLFLQDPKSCQYALPVDSQATPASPLKPSEQDMEWLVGSSLLSYMWSLSA